MTKLRRASDDYIDSLERGKKVKYSNLEYRDGTPADIQTLYFTAIISDFCVLLADTRKDALANQGSVYWIHGILEG